MATVSKFDQLMADVAAGSEAAIWELLETYTPFVIRAARLSLPPTVRQKLDSQDIAQTLWASLLLGHTDLAKLESPDRLIAFLCRAAKNKVIDKTRRLNTQKFAVSREKSLDQRVSAADEHSYAQDLWSNGSTPIEHVSVREQWQHILSQASKRDRQIIEMRMKGCSFSDISEEVHVGEMTARRVIERLVGQLSEE
jgi:RNA polymerase sigma-70 factor (ECF subfamily)